LCRSERWIQSGSINTLTSLPADSTLSVREMEPLELSEPPTFPFVVDGYQLQLEDMMKNRFAVR